MNLSYRNRSTKLPKQIEQKARKREESKVPRATLRYNCDSASEDRTLPDPFLAGNFSGDDDSLDGVEISISDDGESPRGVLIRPAIHNLSLRDDLSLNDCHMPTRGFHRIPNPARAMSFSPCQLSGRLFTYSKRVFPIVKRCATVRRSLACLSRGDSPDSSIQDRCQAF